MWDWQLFGIDFYKIFYFFFVYCFAGWIWESSYVSIKSKHLVNRGFLNGPIIPIYGTAATLIYLTFYNPAMEKLLTNAGMKGILTIFLLGMIVASSLEFVTSFLMEKLFHAKWWDYSQLPLNLQGRICLPVSIFWGFLSVVLVKLLHPRVELLIEWIPKMVGEMAGYVIIVLFLTDLTITVIATVQLDKKINAMQKLREELYEFAYGLKWYETKEEIKGKLEKLHLTELLGRLDKAENKAKELFSKYMETTMDSLQRLILNRIFRAFPTMRVSGREGAFLDLKERLQSYRQKWEQWKNSEK